MIAMVSGTTCSLRLISGGILDFGTMHARFRSSYQRRESFNIRIDAQSGELIEQAAKLVGVKRTDFILDAARRAAQDLLLGHPILTVSPKAYREFVARWMLGLGRISALSRACGKLRLGSDHLPESAGSPAIVQAIRPRN